MNKTDHKQVYGAGFHAGLKTADKQQNSSPARGTNRGYRNAKNSMLCWNPNSNEVELVPWPDDEFRSKKYKMSTLACYSDVREKDFEQRKSFVFIEAMHLIIRDGVDSASVHFALLGLEEYRDGCACDMPWLDDWV